MGNTNNVKDPEKKSQKDQVKEILEKLEQGVTELFESERYKEYLNCMSKFYNYSLNNTLLIAMQKPDATFVTGFHAWHDKHGRNVKKGEKGIKIFAPVKYKVTVDPEAPGEEPKEIEKTGFKVTYVWDISQTEGKELPTIGVNELSGDVKDYDKLYRALRLICPVPVEFGDIGGGSKGYYNDSEKLVMIKSGMSQVQTIKTLLHESAHAMLHSKAAMDPDHPVDRRTMEVEAESIAFTVCKKYGMDTDDYSFGYIAGWSSDKDAKELKNSLERIKDTADKMITGIDKSIERQTIMEEAARNGDEGR
ncbi:MAG: hypothetical protein IJK95_04215 [Firmicutes bacterium]|nr:hypothetical protein [Bacillota bacterium]